MRGAYRPRGSLKADKALCVCMQIANMEYRMVLKNLPMSSIPSARMAYRAAAELLQQVLDANASPNGEAKPGSQRHKNLMAGMTSFIRMMSSWAQMEFDCM